MQEHTNALYRIAPLRDDACIELPYMGMRGHTSISISHPAVFSFSAKRTASSRKISSLPT
jgi:hypothetical protein